MTIYTEITALFIENKNFIILHHHGSLLLLAARAWRQFQLKLDMLKKVEKGYVKFQKNCPMQEKFTIKPEFKILVWYEKNLFISLREKGQKTTTCNSEGRR